MIIKIYEKEYREIYQELLKLNYSSLLKELYNGNKQEIKLYGNFYKGHREYYNRLGELEKIKEHRIIYKEGSIMLQEHNFSGNQYNEWDDYIEHKCTMLNDRITTLDGQDLLEFFPEITLAEIKENLSRHIKNYEV